MADTTVTALVPLLFLVVTQLAQVGRDLDLQTAATERRNPLGIPIIDFVPFVPSLGQFNFVHGVNISQLSVGLILVTLLSEGWVQLGLTLLSWGMIVVVPVLEIDEYSAIVKLENPPVTLRSSNWPLYSFHVHTLIGTAITVFVFYCGEQLPKNLELVSEQLVTVVLFFLVLICLMSIWYVSFLYLLKLELVRLQS